MVLQSEFGLGELKGQPVRTHLLAHQEVGVVHKQSFFLRSVSRWFFRHGLPLGSVFSANIASRPYDRRKLRFLPHWLTGAVPDKYTQVRDGGVWYGT